jgi:hypothetical protein
MGGTLDYDRLNPGNHTFQVAARDVAGSIDKTPATFTWTSLGTLVAEELPPLYITRPNLPQCLPGQSQTEQLPPLKKIFCKKLDVSIFARHTTQRKIDMNLKTVGYSNEMEQSCLQIKENNIKKRRQ